MPTWKLDIVKTGKTTRNKEILWILSQSKYKGPKRQQFPKFWEKIKPFFSDKGLETNNIILKEKNELITNSSTLANLFNNYFINITSTLKLKQSPPKFPSIPNLLIYYRDHMSIKKIKETYKITDKFHLKEVSSEEVKKVIKSLNKKKSAISSCIPVKVLIDSVDTYLPIFTDIINSSIRNDTFPEVTPLFKKADPFNKGNYRPVSLLSHVSKVYENFFSIKSVHTLNRTFLFSLLVFAKIATRKNVRTIERSFR